jgi:hypothetical protein
VVACQRTVAARRVAAAGWQANYNCRIRYVTTKESRMVREAALFEQTSGSPLEAYLLLRRAGKNVPLSWFERASVARK